MLNRTEKALNLLHEEGYYVKNLWGLDDVMIKYNCTEEQAWEVLEKTFENEFINESIFNVIDINAQEMNLEINPKYNQ